MIVTKGTISETALLDVVEILVSAIDARNCSHGHSVRVASYAVQVAEAAGWQRLIIRTTTAWSTPPRYRSSLLA